MVAPLCRGRFPGPVSWRSRTRVCWNPVEHGSSERGQRVSSSGRGAEPTRGATTSRVSSCRLMTDWLTDPPRYIRELYSSNRLRFTGVASRDSLYFTLPYLPQPTAHHPHLAGSFSWFAVDTVRDLRSLILRFYCSMENSFSLVYIREENSQSLLQRWNASLSARLNLHKHLYRVREIYI